MNLPCSESGGVFFLSDANMTLSTLNLKNVRGIM